MIVSFFFVSFLSSYLGHKYSSLPAWFSCLSEVICADQWVSLMWKMSDYCMSWGLHPFLKKKCMDFCNNMKHSISNFRREFTQQFVKCFLINWKIVYQLNAFIASYLFAKKDLCWWPSIVVGDETITSLLTSHQLNTSNHVCLFLHDFLCSVDGSKE